MPEDTAIEACSQAVQGIFHAGQSLIPLANPPPTLNTNPNAPPAVTIKDVALAAGVHPASVSRALNGQDKRVSAETRLRIQQAARDLGYQPNAIAASLRTKQTGLIGIIVPDIGNPLFSPLLQALEIALRRHGQMCLVIQTPEDPQERRQVVHALAGRQISGLLILASENDDPMLEAAALRALRYRGCRGRSIRR